MAPRTRMVLARAAVKPARIAAAALVAALLGIAPSSALAVGWTTPIPLTPAVSAGTPGNPVEAINPHLAVNASGAQAIVWDDYEINSDGRTCLTGEARTRVPGADWSPTTQIGCDAHVEIGPDGTALALWEGAFGLEAATASAGSSFGATKPVDDNGGHAYSSVAATVGPDGRATVAFHWENTVPPSVQYDVFAKTQNADGSWPAARETVEVGATSASATSTPGYGLDVAAGPQGDVVIASNISAPVSSPDSGKQTVVTYTRLTAAQGNSSGAWVKRSLLIPSGNNHPTLPLIAVDPQDRFTVMDAILVNTTYLLYAWTRPANTSAWPASPEVVPNATNTVDRLTPGFALDSKGNAQTAFGFPAADHSYTVHNATRAAASSSWVAGTPTDLGPAPCETSSMPAPSVTFDSTDLAIVSFDCSSGSLMFTRPAGSTVFSAFSPPSGAQGVELFTDPNGYVVATWTANGVTYTSVYDAIAPTLDAVTPPSNPVAGEPAVFAVSGSDVWGPVTYSIDFGDGSVPLTGRAVAPRRLARLARAAAAGAVSHAYANPGAYTATVSVTDNAANSASTTVPVSVAPVASSGQVTVAPPPVAVPGLPAPVAGVSANVAPVKPVVRIKAPGKKAFVPLTGPAQIKIGSVIDTRKGRVRITIANGLGKLETAEFYEGLFKLTQPRAKPGQRWFANLLLQGGRFKGCPAAPRHPRIARKRQQSGSVRHLWASGSGSFRTKGRFASATIRGTTWLTDDRCNGTLTKVTAGKVGVRDFVLKKTILLTKGKRYLAHP
jgi:hypothetical protein